VKCRVRTDSRNLFCWNQKELQRRLYRVVIVFTNPGNVTMKATYPFSWHAYSRCNDMTSHTIRCTCRHILSHDCGSTCAVYQLQQNYNKWQASVAITILFTIYNNWKGWTHMLIVVYGHLGPRPIRSLYTSVLCMTTQLANYRIDRGPNWTYISTGKLYAMANINTWCHDKSKLKPKQPR